MKSISLVVATLLATSSALAEPVMLVVDFKDNATVQDIQDTEKDLGFGLVPNSDMFSATKIAVAHIDSRNAEDLISRIQDDSDIENVEVAVQYAVPEQNAALAGLFEESDETGFPMGGAPFETPNDSVYDKQKWNFGMIELEKAWKHATGKGVIVAILDTGISDGRNKAYPRVGDLEQTCILEGYNFNQKNKDPYDRQSHGSHVGSTVAESTNNKIGGVGIAFDACLLPVKVLSDSGSGWSQDIAEGIRWAADHKANIINMSLGGGGYSKIMADAVKYAADRNVLVFCAAGNAAQPKIEFPAAYDGCLAISSVGPDKKLAYYSSYGEGGDGIFLAAPGGNKRDFGDEGGVWQSTVNPNNPKQWGMFPYQGTSMATPTAAGVAALVVSHLLEHDGKYDAEEVKDIMLDSATDMGDEFKYGAGIVNAGAAMELVADNGNGGKLAVAGGALATVLFFVFRKKK